MAARCGRRSRSVPVMRDIERDAADHARAGARLKPAASDPTRYAAPADSDLARILRTRAAALDGPTALNEMESKSLLRAYGIPLPHGASGAAPPAEALDAAHRIGFPVVLKARIGRASRTRATPAWCCSICRDEAARPQPATRSSWRAPAPSASSSTASWWRSRSPAAPNACLASAAIRKWARSSCSVSAASWSNCSRT